MGNKERNGGKEDIQEGPVHKNGGRRKDRSSTGSVSTNSLQEDAFLELEEHMSRHHKKKSKSDVLPIRQRD